MAEDNSTPPGQVDEHDQRHEKEGHVVLKHKSDVDGRQCLGVWTLEDVVEHEKGAAEG